MRRLSQRYVVRARLRLETPLHVGGASADLRSDLPLAEDGQGRHYVPGTSLAGALRAALRCPRQPGGSQGSAPDVYPWGPPPRRRGAGDRAGDQASWILVEDAILEPAGNGWEIRDHVGIARDIGAAAPGIKYDRMVLPRGTVLPLALTLEVPEGRENDAQRELTALLHRLVSGIRFGAARSRGLGLARLCGEPEIRLQDGLLTADGIKALLRARIQSDGGLVGTPALQNWRERQSGAAAAAIDITLDWRPTSPIMVRSGEEGIAVDMLPLVSGDDEAVSLVLPGSTVKGALRAHAERILRTVFGAPAPAINDPSGKRGFLYQIGQDELALARWLFGAPGERKQTSGPETGSHVERSSTEDGPAPGLAALWIDDVYLRRPFARADWQRIAGALELVQAKGAAAPIEQHSGVALDPSMHVAVDRWTGGAAEHQLYSVLEPHVACPTAWEPIRLTIRLDRLRDKDRHPVLALLLLTLRDFCRGAVPIGFGGNRGLGAVKIETVAYDGLAALGTAVGAPYPDCADDPCLRALPKTLLEEIRAGWRTFVAAHTKEAG